MRFFSDDPARDAERYMDYLDARLAKRPVCHCCGENIQEEHALHYVASDVDIWLCEECIDRNQEYIEVD